MSRRTVVAMHGGGYKVGSDYHQTDWDFPAAAESLGWSLRRVQIRGSEVVAMARIGRAKGDCEHRRTGGTARCPDCGIAASEFIAAASDYLWNRATGY